MFNPSGPVYLLAAVGVVTAPPMLTGKRRDCPVPLGRRPREPATTGAVVAAQHRGRVGPAVPKPKPFA